MMLQENPMNARLGCCGEDMNTGMTAPIVLTPQEKMELQEISVRLKTIYDVPAAQLKLVGIMMAYNPEMKDNELIISVVSPMYKYLTLGERWKAAWALLAAGWPELLKNRYVTLDLMSDEEFDIIMKHEQIVQRT